ncbi:MAG TPA: hypothetical protein VJT78_15670, partial [Candidatus Dormibacteraeota bacterium]|nr:hypothetical protein [Candidatus Dormibacteraeota bacterium]
YAPAAVALVVAASAVLAAVLLLFQDPLAQLFFGSSRYADLITPMPLLVLGGALHGIAYGYLRGRSRIQRANILIGFNHAVVPLLAIPLSGGSVARILLWMGGLWVASSLAFLVFAPLALDGVPKRVGELARFGVPRIPGDLLRLGLFSFPSLAVAHVADIATAGSVAFGVAAVGMLGTALSPIGFVMLPVSARMMAAGEIAELRRRVVTITALTATFLLVGVGVVELLAPQLVAIYLGGGFGATATAVRVIAPAALPWGVYMSLASVVDAHHVRPVNARNMAVAFAVFAAGAGVMALFHLPSLAIAGAFVVSLYVLGVLTVLEVSSITSRERDVVLPLAPESQPLV